MSSRCSGSETTALFSTSSTDDLLAVARVGVLQPVARVLHLHRGEVLRRGAVQVHPPARVEREVARVGHPQQPEPQPVGVVPPLPRVGREEPLRGGVRADHERHLAQPGEDPSPRGVERLGTGRAGGVRRGHARAVPPQRLREGGAGDVAAVPVAHGLATHDQVDVLPRDVAVRECLPCCVHAVAHEVAPPLAPGVHPDSEYGDVRWTHWSASSPSSSPLASSARWSARPSRRCRASRRPPRPRCRRARRRRRSRRPAAPARRCPPAARRRRARTARRARWRGCTAPAAGTARRCRTTPSLDGTARSPRSPHRRRPGCGRSPRSAGRTPSRTSCTATRPGPARRRS